MPAQGYAATTTSTTPRHIQTGANCFTTVLFIASIKNMATIKSYTCGEEKFENLRGMWKLPKYICRDKGDNGKIYENESTCYKWNRTSQIWQEVQLDDTGCKDAKILKAINPQEWQQSASEQDIEQFRCSCDKEIQVDDFINVYGRNQWSEENGHLGPSLAPPTKIV